MKRNKSISQNVWTLIMVFDPDYGFLSVTELSFSYRPVKCPKHRILLVCNDSLHGIQQQIVRRDARFHFWWSSSVESGFFSG